MGKYIRRGIKLLKQFLAGDFNQLLIFLILLFIFQPYDLGLKYIVIWHFFFSAVLLAAIFNCHHTKKVKIMALIIGVPTILADWLSLFWQIETTFVIAQFAALFFLVFAILSLLQKVLLGKVTADVLRGTICVYFLIGYAFSFAFSLLEFLEPGAFHLTHGHEALFGAGIYPSEMLYFSFVTLLAIGYGDITPLHDLGQMLSVLEGIVGEFYLAILVSRLVTVYSRRSKAEQQKGSKLT